MTKQAEIDFIKNIGPDGEQNLIKKPFSYDEAGRYLMEIGAIFGLLPKPPAKLLDLGCGTGWTSIFFAKHGYNVTGQDIAPDATSLASKLKDQEDIKNLEFTTSDYENLPFENEFDIAIFFNSLHHAENEENAINSAFRALKKDGVVIFSEPGKRHENSASAKNAREKLGVTEKSLSPKYLAKIGKKCGFYDIKIYPHAYHIYKTLYGRSDNSRINRLLKFRPIAYLFTLWIIFFYKTRDGIVIMRKK